MIGRLDSDLRRRLTAQSDLPGLLRISLHLACICLTGAYVASGLAFWPLALIAEGVLLTFLFSPLHETIHATAFRSDRLNTVVAQLCGFLILLTPAHFRYFHMAHHRFTHDPDRDPELAHPKPAGVGAHLVYMSGLPEWASRIAGLTAQARAIALPAYVPERGRARVVRQARIYIALYGILAALSFATGSSLLFWIWILPNLIGQPFMRGYLLAEHTGCPNVSNMLFNTRTTFTNRIVRWLAWNMPYHIEHHTYPAVPFHRLPDLHAEIATALGTTADGYARFNAQHLAHLAATPQGKQTGR